MVATTTALLIAAGVAGGASVASAEIGSHAAHEAAAMQQQSAQHAMDVQGQSSEHALDFARQAWQQSQQNMQPWLNAGRASLGTLMNRMGMPGGSSGGGSGIPGSGGAPRMPGMPSGMQTLPPAASLGSVYGARPATGVPIGTAVPRNAPLTTSVARVQWPDGTQAQVPRAQLPHYVSLGAEEVT